MNEVNETVHATESPLANREPAAATVAGNMGKLFTQEEVDSIVKGRLARERGYAEESAQREVSLNEREAVLNAREEALNCREYVMTKGYPKELLEILDTSDAESFKQKADGIFKTFERRAMRAEVPAPPLASTEPPLHDDYGAAFKAAKHTPKKFEIRGEE